MRFIGNIIWLVFGGIFVAIEYFIGSLALIVTIIGIPFGIQTFKLGLLALWPFGREAVQTKHANGCLSVLMNVIWILCGGLLIAISHVIWGIVFSITIIGIPFGRQHFKLAGLALMPFATEIRIKQ
ncbi:MAG: YccF domain-containing protein [Marinilabiliaceae bacterium]|nr:YccF domain-containing protein [Marinilabiliaceae bacterium]